MRASGKVLLNSRRVARSSEASRSGVHHNPVAGRPLTESHAPAARDDVAGGVVGVVGREHPAGARSVRMVMRSCCWIWHGPVGLCPGLRGGLTAHWCRIYSVSHGAQRLHIRNKADRNSRAGDRRTPSPALASTRPGGQRSRALPTGLHPQIRRHLEDPGSRRTLIRRHRGGQGETAGTHIRGPCGVPAAGVVTLRE